MFRNKAHTFLFALLLTLPVLPANATITATPTVSPLGPQPVYTPVTITFGATDTGPGPVNYRVAVAAPGDVGAKSYTKVQASPAPRTKPESGHVLPLERNSAEPETV